MREGGDTYRNITWLLLNIDELNANIPEMQTLSKMAPDSRSKRDSKLSTQFKMYETFFHFHCQCEIPSLMHYFSVASISSQGKQSAIP